MQRIEVLYRSRSQTIFPNRKTWSAPKPLFKMHYGLTLEDGGVLKHEDGHLAPVVLNGRLAPLDIHLDIYSLR